MIRKESEVTESQAGRGEPPGKENSKCKGPQAGTARKPEWQGGRGGNEVGEVA